MKHPIKTLPALSLIFATAALAGQGSADKGGNGGTVYVCKDALGHPSVRLLDFVEAERRGIPIALGDPSLSVEEKIDLALARLRRLDPIRANRYATRAAAFYGESQGRKGSSLSKIDDFFDYEIPAGCEPHQLVIQRQPKFPEDRLYTYNQDIWDKMDSTQIAGTILHEVIYREAIELGHTDSDRARYFNSVLCSNRFEGMDPESYPQFLKQSGFPAISPVWNQGRRYLPDSLRMHTNGSISTGILAEPTSVAVGRALWMLEGRIAFDTEGRIKSGNFSAPTNVTIGERQYLLRGEFEINAHGTLIRATADAAIQVGPKMIPLTGKLQWNTDGRILQGTLTEAIIERVLQGGFVFEYTFKIGDVVVLDENELLDLRASVERSPAAAADAIRFANESRTRLTNHKQALVCPYGSHRIGVEISSQQYSSAKGYLSSMTADIPIPGLKDLNSGAVFCAAPGGYVYGFFLYTHDTANVSITDLDQNKLLTIRNCTQGRRALPFTVL